MLSVRVLETRNINGNERFPDPADGAADKWHISDDCIELPRGALIENSDGGLVRIVFVAFDRLETILRPTWVTDAKLHSVTDSSTVVQQQLLALNGARKAEASAAANGGAGNSAGGGVGNGNAAAAGAAQSPLLTPPPPRQRILNSKVISASLGKGRHIQLSQPIRLVLRHLRTENVTNAMCVFWNYIDQ